MKSIRAGDVYFLSGPFHGEDINTAQEKHLCHLLGTLSARPVVVIRPPMWWDDYNTVTVIPTINKCNPAITLTLEDRQGRTAKSDYPFTPQMPYAVPTSRLGKYIGSLDPEELEELIYAFKWIHDPFMQMDSNNKVPNVFHDVISKRTPKGSRQTPDETRVQLFIAENGTINSTMNPEVNGLNISSGCKIIPGTVKNTIQQESTPNTKGGPGMATVKTFPKSIFDEKILSRVASRFVISDDYYDGSRKTRSPYMLKYYEVMKLQSDLSDDDFESVLAYYSMMSAFDAYILGPRLPLETLIEITQLSREKAIVLKSLCNYMRNILQTDYENRVAEHEAANKSQTNSHTDAECKKSPNELQAGGSLNAAVYDKMMQKVRPYLTTKGITRMPTDAAKLFMQIPKWRIKRAYTGIQFEQKYTEAVQLYKDLTERKDA